MKIGFDAKRLYNNFTGLGNYSRTLVSNLHQYFPKNQYYLYTPKIKKDLTTEPFLNNPDYHTRCHNGLFKSAWRSSFIKKDLKKDKIDIYHGLSHELPFHIDQTGIRSIVTIHDIIFRTFPDMYTAIDRSIYNYKFRYACQHADKIIAISECTKRDIIKYFGTPPEKIQVIYQAIQPTFQVLQTPEAVEKTIQKFHLPEEYLLYVGAINSRKNLLHIVKALPLLPRQMQIPLVIVGNGHQYKEEVLKYATKANLSKQLILIHNLHDTKELQAFYQKAKIFIYPSYYEGFGLPVTEALLSKVPVITSNRSSLPEAGGPASCYIDPDSPEEIAHAIETILSDENRQREMIEQGYLFAKQQFEAKSLTQQIHQLYQEIYRRYE
ncbi:glycosyltransferase family 4 protein [Odoribacter lunatus]|uniref:glycosyltransferase family 4 protein n=1 Tax=Odoribacter lunatus TaxID=2941335 RepID=UPI00203EC40D|nr:glycosyltransferase family 1 protein [Odoribacter lunatus]